MTLDRILWITWVCACSSACALDPPPSQRPIDCESDRAAERYPETCDDDAGEESASEDE